ncbi:MAG: peptidoglycan DD-metalloendopeptidase family protein [Flavobacteriaceae bacterium]|nr:peptidoglycan DD-metalloendopeptidase family protein [Flavobacteriaceae bacterium]
MSKSKIIYISIVAVFIITVYGVTKANNSNIIYEIIEEKEIVPVIEYGFDYSEYIVKTDTIRSNDTFGKILFSNHFDSSTVYSFVNEAKGIFDIRRLNKGKKYTILFSNDSIQKPSVFIYEQDKENYIVFDNKKDSILVYKKKKTVITVIKEASGVIGSSLYETLNRSNLSPVIAGKLSNIYAWTINFFAIQKGDSFKIIYEDKYVNDTVYAGVGQIKAAYFYHASKKHYAFRFVEDSLSYFEEYFDDKAVNMRRAFLKAPLKFSSRISSRYNLKRKIALYGRVKAHRGTDFPAAVGTPIISTADGRVINSERRKANGNYVKIKHGNTPYMTQYLHMSRRKVKVGQYVKQGDVIGYVGMTGNTSGPHVCYRFWKNGRQVDPLRQKLPAAKPMKKETQKVYLEFIKEIKTQLDSIS